jgi:trans-aconitate 2-methyltransferase
MDAGSIDPAIDLAARIELTAPGRILDLGCGPGNSTEVLRHRWPEAAITGLDSSPQMIATAHAGFPHGVWQVGDAASWVADEPLDLVFSNAALQWVPDHARICRRWLDQLKPGGALAAQMPAHYDSPLHREIIQVSKDPAWNDRMNAPRAALTNHAPSFYYDVLTPVASRIDLWETTYYHIVAGPESVVEWFRGTGLRPYLQALSSDEERGRFEQMLLDRYRFTYPRQSNGRVLFPFRRLFFVAYR